MPGLTSAIENANSAEASSFAQVRLVCASLIWLGTSMLLALTLKEILDPKYMGFSFPLFTTVFSFFVSFILMVVFCRAPDLTSKAMPVFKTVILPLGAATALEVATSNAAYPLISVSLMSIMKCATMVTTLIAGCMIGVEKPSAYIFTLALLVVGGVAIACGEVEIEAWQGLVWISVSTGAFTWRTLLAQSVKKTFPFTPMEMTYVTAPAAGLWLLPVALGSEVMRLTAWQIPVSWTSGMQTTFFLKLFSVPVIAFVNMVAMFEVVHTSSSLSMAVLVALRQVLTIFGSISFFGDRWTVKAWAGLALALCAMILYARDRSGTQASVESIGETQAADAEACTGETQPLLRQEGANCHTS